MYTLSVTSDTGDTLQLTNNPAYDIVDVDGIIGIKSNINYTDLVGYDGGSFDSAHASPRNIVITVHPKYPVEKNRLELMRYFHSGRQVTIHYKNAHRDVVIDGRVEGPDGSLFSMTQEIQISIICLDPWFKDVNQIVATVQRERAAFEFPVEFEPDGIEFSTIEEAQRIAIEYAGERDTGMIITLTATGQVHGPTIHNVTRNEVYVLNTTLEAGDVVTIDSRYGNKSVTLRRNLETTDLIGDLVEGSVWPVVDIGENIYGITADYGVENMTAEMVCTPIYGGV